MYNKIILLGNLVRDIEIRYSASGSAIGNTAIATTRKFKGADGQQKEEVLFVDITFFGRSAEIANQYLRKGSKILVDGRLKLDQWTAQDGSKKSKHSVTVESMQMLDSKPQGEHQQQPSQYTTPQNNVDDANRHNSGGNHNRPSPQQENAYAKQNNTPPILDINEDEIPF